ncbi:MAG: nitroreductase family protein, partial [Desulfofustis sp.]|nr:nitroreductase family protein [Desulfofustis sp.]
MDVREALKNRKSTRAFLDREVSKEKVIAILEAARHTPSGVNTQPWQVAAVSGDTKMRLQEKIEAAFRNGVKPVMDFQYYPLKWVEPYKTRRFDCGLQLYETLGIKRQDKERRLEQWVANYRSFDAPVALFFFMDSGLETGSYMDYGMFM